MIVFKLNTTGDSGRVVKDCRHLMLACGLSSKRSTRLRSLRRPGGLIEFIEAESDAHDVRRLVLRPMTVSRCDKRAVRQEFQPSVGTIEFLVIVHEANAI